VTRIVAGLAKGRRLAVPPRGTRPTSDRAREALFSSLDALVDIDGARVLDLYAGTGGVGLEALSRGASWATFVESDRAVCELLRTNIRTVGIDKADVQRRQAASYLVGAGVDEPFDFVFADPPYAVSDTAVAALLLELGDPRWLAPGGIVVIERSARGAEPTWPDVMEPISHKRYGEGVLWYGRRR